MKRFSLFVSGVVLSVVSLPAPAWGQANAQRGAEVLRRERCVECHTVSGQGSATPAVSPAPDLGKRQPRAYTPATLASVMWNHAPRMWPALEEKKIAIPKLSEQDSEDVFAYFYSLWFFDKPGDATRGAKVFDEKGCSGCHSLSLEEKGHDLAHDKGPGSNGPGAPVAMWKSAADPVLMVQQMWNHASSMKDAQAKKHMTWVTVTGQDLLDISAYLSSLPVAHEFQPQFSLPSPASGKPLFEARCAVCHQGTLSLERRLSNLTLTEVAADMWNHAPRMMNGPILSATEMRKVVAYVWERQYMGPAGDVAKGRELFVAKRCASCHEGAGAVVIARGERVFTPLKMVSAVWVHGPSMLKKLEGEGHKWPMLSPEEVADLVAYLNTQP